MIDQIIGLILQEARSRPGEDRIQIIYDVIKEVESSMQVIVDTARDIERGFEANEKES